MRKCVIHTRVVQENGQLSEPTPLVPFVHQALYNIPSIRAARLFLDENEYAEMVAIRIEADVIQAYVKAG